ncbi:shikimate dehydrogenase [Geosporobacter ferrireducens]|uniref:Shikimate dehydrogenase n=1 Tax=Geosporobacter ferrireducens TaxID=1424294 RepID=A0A1D8GKB5_9FIRM|nr:shikimate dehydrogenase [Geosporobacter ferrireducens]AOT71355.1 shikimate dehydrogenase [Geosporobacter ferrireducens]MTI57667.1 shikimate dehydrogenase [Geosporobacter ferrireducens]
MKTGKFAFCIHPIELKDIERKYGFLRYVPKKAVYQLTKRIPPMEVSKITGIASNYGSAEGWFVGVPLVTDQIMTLPEEFVIHKIIQAGKKAEALGAKVFGLGAFTSVVGDGGITIRKHLKIPVTTGNSYTVAAAIEAVKEAAMHMGKDLKLCNAAVVGATGSIGRICALLLAPEVNKITLAAQDVKGLETVAEEILQRGKGNAEIETTLEKSLKKADIVITVSSAVDAIIQPEYLKTGAIVCDVARPRDVSREVEKKRKDILVIEGGVIEVPGDVDFGFDFGFPPGLSYACMAETMILALENKYEDFSIGKKLSIEKVEEIAQLARKHGFKLAGMRSFEKVVKKEYIEGIKENIKKVAYMEMDY